MLYKQANELRLTLKNHLIRSTGSFEFVKLSLKACVWVCHSSGTSHSLKSLLVIQCCHGHYVGGTNRHRSGNTRNAAKEIFNMSFTVFN